MPFLGATKPSRSIPLLGLPRIDWHSHQALGLTHCYRHDVGEAVNLVTGKVDATWQGFDQEDVSRFGVGRRANASASSGDGVQLSVATECPLSMSALFTVSDVGTLVNHFFWRDFDGGRRFYNFAGNFMMNWGGNFTPGGSGAGFGAPTDGSPFTIIYACDDSTRTGRYGYYFLNHRTGEYRSATGTHARADVVNTWQLFYSGSSRVPGIHHEYRVYTDHFIDEPQAKAILGDLDGLYEPEPRLYFFPSGAAGAQTLTASLFTNTNTFGTDTVTPAAMDLTASVYNDADSFNTDTVSLTLAQTSTLSDADSFGTDTVTSLAVDLTALVFNDGDTFGQDTVTVAAGVQALIGTVFTDPDSFNTDTVNLGLTQDAVFDDAGAVFTHSAQQSLVQTTLEDADVFPSDHDLSFPQTITGSLVEKPDSVSTHTVRIVGEGAGIQGKKSMFNPKEWMDRRK